ncbi:MAG: hypothetical protein L0Z49_12395 [Actinobacteria bacterium]|nr:hypothetical protein [Actinomycetota bacterium]
MGDAKTMDFLEWVRNRGVGRSFEDGVRAVDPKVWKYVADGQYIWKDGTPKERQFDFREFFPINNGGEPPYFRQRAQVDRREGYLFALYKQKGGRGEFEPFPLPTPEQLGDDEE